VRKGSKEKTRFEAINAGEFTESDGVDEFGCVTAWGAVSIFNYLIYSTEILEVCIWGEEKEPMPLSTGRTGPIPSEIDVK